MRFHALQSMDEDALSLDVDRLVFSGEGALDITSRPESVSHLSPWLLRVCSESCGAVLAYDETRRCFCKLDVHDIPLVDVALD